MEAFDLPHVILSLRFVLGEPAQWHMRQYLDRMETHVREIGYINSSVCVKYLTSDTNP